MTSDPLEVMRAVVIQEASRLQVVVDDELAIDAEAIAQAESTRSRIRDRLDAARGAHIRLHLCDGPCAGILREVGDSLIVLENEESCQAISIAAILVIDSLPRALRQERGNPPRPSLTWPALLREWSNSILVRFTLVDGRVLRARIQSVSSDHADLRDAEGTGYIVLLPALRSAVISR